MPHKPIPVLMFLVTEDWYFLSHRLPMARAARDHGYEVHVATHLNGHGPEIEREGFHLHPLKWRRGSVNPLNVLQIIGQVRGLYRRIKPDLVHHVALQPSIIGSLAAAGLPVIRLYAMAGLGYGFTSRNAKARLMQPILSFLLRMGLNRPRAAVLVQNPEDRESLAALGIVREKISLIGGSGVDIDALRPLPEPSGPVTVAFVGRLLDDKGLHSLIAAHDLLMRRGEKIKLLIAGDRDPANPSSVSETDVELWRRRPYVEILGHVEDIRQVWERAHIAVLPSRREGLPKCLLEAAAFGRPLVATDVPGCREIARDGLNALLVPPDDSASLAYALSHLARNGELRLTYGTASRRIVEDAFSSASVGREIVALYDRLLGRGRRLLPQAAPHG